MHFLNYSPRQGVALGFVLLCFIGLVDGITGHQLDFSAFYLLPIFLISWTAGRRAGIWMSLISAGVNIIVDLLSGKPSTYLFIEIWTLLVTSLVYVVMVLLLTRLKTALEIAEALANNDSLTGIANSRAFFTGANRELARCRRKQQPLTLLYLDCDGFKQINDTFGHQTGDDVLRTVAITLQHTIRVTDIAARLGGDEFAVLLPALDATAARTMATRVREELLGAMHQHDWPMTFSIGVVTYTLLPDHIDDLVHEADQLMYEVKRTGKDAVAFAVIAEHSPLTHTEATESLP
ncbi:MAG: GGDEF domain-containing protein [Chloroflexaceae bacterium]|nr:GGDEF domain-containing protein [Chloroflexaceae bacterium]